MTTLKKKNQRDSVPCPLYKSCCYYKQCLPECGRKKGVGGVKGHSKALALIPTYYEVVGQPSKKRGDWCGPEGRCLVSF